MPVWVSQGQFSLPWFASHPVNCGPGVVVVLVVVVAVVVVAAGGGDTADVVVAAAAAAPAVFVGSKLEGVAA